MEDVCTCGDDDVVVIDPDGEMKSFFLKIYWVSPCMLHLEHYRYSSAGAHDLTGYFSAYELLHKDIRTLPGYRRSRWLPDITPNVGASASAGYDLFDDSPQKMPSYRRGSMITFR